MTSIGRATLLFGDNIDAQWHRFDAIITDPPYGINYRVNARSFANRGAGLDNAKCLATQAVAPIAGDAGDFDPAPWLACPKVAFFGAHHFAHRLPQGRWLIWDKRRDSKPDAHSDGDTVWFTGDHRSALRIHRQKWRGVVREGEENISRSRKLHPNQKPVALIDVVIAQLGLKAGDTVFDPFMGSGSTGVAALRRGLNFLGCEIDPAHFETACGRLAAEQGIPCAAPADDPSASTPVRHRGDFEPA